MVSYNYENFSSSRYDLGDFAGPAPGDRAPDAVLELADGSRRRLLDFEGDFLVIETGSVTCPLFQTRRKTMVRLSSEYENVDFVVLYVREAHPGARISQHREMTEKVACARRLDDGGGDRRLVLIDDMDGSVHKAYGGFPNAVFIVNRNGCVVFASDWNDPQATGQALKLLQEGKPADVRSFFKPVSPAVGVRTFRSSGRGSARDFFKGLPVLFWQNMIRRNLRVLAGGQPVAGPDVNCRVGSGYLILP